MQYTTFSEIYHLFLNYIQDYTIRNLFRTNLEVADDMMRTFLVMAVTKFYNCVKDIKSLDIENSKFVCNLDIEEKNILAEWMVVNWMERTVNDITQMNLLLNDNDFKHYSEESNLKQKSERLDRIREKVSQDMVVYGLYHTPFNKWADGDYDV